MSASTSREHCFRRKWLANNCLQKSRRKAGFLRFGPLLLSLVSVDILKGRGARTRPAVALTLDMLELAPPAMSSHPGDLGFFRFNLRITLG